MRFEKRGVSRGNALETITSGSPGKINVVDEKWDHLFRLG